MCVWRHCRVTERARVAVVASVMMDMRATRATLAIRHITKHRRTGLTLNARVHAILYCLLATSELILSSVTVNNTCMLWQGVTRPAEKLVALDLDLSCVRIVRLGLSLTMKTTRVATVRLFIVSTYFNIRYACPMYRSRYSKTAYVKHIIFSFIVNFLTRTLNK